MIATESDVFFQISDNSGELILLLGKVVELKDNLYTAELEKEGLILKEREDLFICYKIKQKFLRQAARIDTVTQTEAKIMVQFETLGDPVSGEKRQSYRVSSIGVDLKAKFGREENCRVVDLSSTGFAVYGAERHKIGSRVKAVLHYEEGSFSGMVAIMSARERSKGKIRYGVYCVDDEKSGSNLKKSLTQISLAIQRRQLARFSRLE